MSSDKKSKKAVPISSLLEEILASKGLASKLKKYRTWEIWDEVVGPQIAKYAQPLRIRDSVLEIRVNHTTWMQQLQLLKPKILKELNKHLGEERLDDIYLKRGEFEQEIKPPEPEQAPLPELSDEQRNNIVRLTKEINDKELKQTLSKLLTIAGRHENSDQAN